MESSRASGASCSRPTFRIGGEADLSAVNQVVTAAVLAWPMAERVKRNALSLLRYGALDLTDLEFRLAEAGDRVVGVAAWDRTTRVRGASGEQGALLHGLYVRPRWQHRGVGRALQRLVSQAAAGLGFDGLLVKAERVSVGYFERCGYRRLDGEHHFGVSYPYLFWLPLGSD